MIIIRKDTVWGPGIRTLDDDVQVAKGATLTIKPGAQIIGNGHSIEAYGTVSAVGTKNAPIFFEKTKLGLSDNYEAPGSLIIDYAHIDGGSLGGYSVGSFGAINLSNSFVYGINEQTYIYGSDKASSFINNVFSYTSGFDISYGAKATFGKNVFDGYNGTGSNIAIETSASDTYSFENAYLVAGSPTLQLNYSYGEMKSYKDYFGTNVSRIVGKMIIDANDDLSIGHYLDLQGRQSSPSVNTVSSMFSFTTTWLPRDVIVEIRLMGNRDISAYGNKLNNIMYGNTGNNIIDGGLGADKMSGGAGDDFYLVDHVRDVIVEGRNKGYDSVVSSVSYALSSNVELLRLSGSKAINATGNALANHLIGNGAANVLDGKGGADLMEGGAGNDVYFVDHAADRVIEAIGEGRDTVVTTVNYKLAAEQQIEILQTADANGKAALKLTGNAFGNKLVGNAGDNVLDGGAGADEMRGGAGNDTYLVDHARDAVFEAVGGGTDTVLASVGYALKAGQEIENLRLTAKAGSVDLTGNEFGQTLVGNVGVNVLDGGLGADVLTGGKGADTFVFSTALGAGNVDRITDFSAVDTIRLSKGIFAALAPGELKAGEFKDLAKGKVDADDHILYDSRTGDLFYDADGSGKAAAVKFAVLDNKAVLTHADFLIA